MKFSCFSPVLMLALCGSAAIAQTMPEHAPVDVSVGGSGAAAEALNALPEERGEIFSLQNIRGPSGGKNRNRTQIHQYPITAQDVPIGDGYYLRSSYVTLGVGGFAPLHSHDKRPAFLQAVAGQIHQHRSDGQSFVMGPGDFTFSSDRLAHWWVNQSLDTPTTLWIVEICSEPHKCVAPINGGAVKLPEASKAVDISGRQEGHNSKSVFSVDLAGEFFDTPGLEDYDMRLLRHELAPGETFVPARFGPGVSYVRVDQGDLTNVADLSPIAQGSVFLSRNPSAETAMRNDGQEPAVLFSVQLHKSSEMGGDHE